MHSNQLRLLIASLLAAWLTSSSVMGGPIGTNFQVSETGCAFPDVAYSTGSDRYLVAYGHGRVRGRLVKPTGQLDGTEKYISDPVAGGGLFPDVAYNAANDEFLVVWDDQRKPDAGQAESAVWGQRVRASDGANLGGNFAIGDTGSTSGCSVAWNPVNNSYLVVWRAGFTTRGRWVWGDRDEGEGTVNGSAFNISSDYLYPHVAFGATSFLITWDCANGTVVGRCLAPGSTQPGSLIPITGSGTGWRTAAAYDPGGGAHPARWLVQFMREENGNPPDQLGAFVSSQGVADGVVFPIAQQPSHEGDNNFGGAIAFIPNPPRYMSIFQNSVDGVPSGTSVQELDRNGQPRGEQDFISVGDELGQAVAGNPETGQFLNCWYSRQTATVYARLYEPIRPVTQLTGVPATRAVRLSWINPSTPDFTATVIRYKTNGYPTSPNDGYVAVVQPGSPGSVGTFTHTGLAGGATVYYAAFAKDSTPHTSDPTTLAVVSGLTADFDTDQDVDQDDFAHLQLCLTEQGGTAPAECLDADLDVDGDVDGSDAVAFIRCFNGPSRPPGC